MGEVSPAPDPSTHSSSAVAVLYLGFTGRLPVLIGLPVDREAMRLHSILPRGLWSERTRTRVITHVSQHGAWAWGF